MKHFVCDRCGKEYKPDEQYKEYILKKQVEKGAEYVDLCRFCYFSLLSWTMNGKEEWKEYESGMKKLINDIIKAGGEPNDFGEEQ